MLHSSSKIGWGNENQNKGNKGKICPPKKSVPRENENSIATENRGRICP